MKHILTLLNRHGLGSLRNGIKVEIEAMMSLHVEAIGCSSYYHPTAQLVSLAHYGKQNGDLMRDPEVVLALELDATGKIIDAAPVYYRNDYLGMEQTVYSDEGKKNERLAADLTHFLRDWEAGMEKHGYFR